MEGKMPDGQEEAPGETLFQQAMDEKDHKRQRRMLLYAVNAGSLKAASRMIDIAAFAEMEFVDIDKIASWKERRNLAIGMRTARQIYAVILANHIGRIEIAPEQRNAHFLNARAMLLEEPIPQDARLLDAVACLLVTIDPKDFDRAASFFDQAARLYGETGNQMWQGLALHNAAVCLQPDKNSSGDWNKAAELHKEVAQICHEAGDKAGECQSWRCRAFCLNPERNSDGDWNLAADSWAQAARLHGEMGDKNRQGIALYNQAFCLLPKNNPNGDLDEATTLFERAAKLLDNKEEKGMALLNQAFYLQPGDNPNGDWNKAAGLFKDAADLFEEVGNKDRQGEALNKQAICLYYKGDCDDAAKLFEKAARLLGNNAEKGTALFFQAVCLQPDHNPKGDWNLAADAWAQAAHLYSELGDKYRQGVALYCQAVCLLSKNNPKHDRDHIATLFEKIAQLQDNKEKKGTALFNHAFYLQPDHNPKGNWNKPAGLFKDAAELLGNNWVKCKSLYHQAYCLENSPDGDRNRAATLCEQAAQLLLEIDASNGGASP